MLTFHSLVAASAALTFVSGVQAFGPFEIMKRNQEPSQPSCTDFTAFVYAGCFQDLDSPNPDALLFKGPKNQNMTVEQCVAFCKGNDYRYAGLEYYSECFCGASVNGPQVDESQCNAPCTGNASETCGANKRLNVYQDPTFPAVDDTTTSDYKPLGCYSEGTSGRSLAWRQSQLSTTNLTIESCLFACKDGGFPIAGVEYGKECYCGVVLGNGTLPLNSTSCNLPCTGDKTETCGGRSTLNLFVASDLESSQPCENGGTTTSSTVTSTTTTSSSSTSSTDITTTTTGTITSTSSTVTSTSTSESSTSTSTTSSDSTISTSTSSSSSSSSTSSTPTTTSTSTTPTTSSTSSTSTSSVPSTTSTTSGTLTTTSPTSTPTTTVRPTTSTTKTTASLCTSTYIVSSTPTCEYKCGNWCSTPLPPFVDSNSCLTAVSSCKVQLASCFLHAGFPDSLNCFAFSSWCSQVSSYCGSFCPGGKCSKGGCASKYPPSGPSVPPPVYSTSIYTCPVATSTAKPTTSTTQTSTSSCAIPSNTNICKQPSNSGKGYTSDSPVGNIALPCLTCNNIKSDYNAGNPFKLYTFADSSKCPSYSRGGGGNNGCIKACKDACDRQYDSCMDTYAQSCKSDNNWGGWGRGKMGKRGDSYSSASQKCKDQWNDCYAVNSNVNGGNRCGSWNSGWY